jgi:hypothetical protein
MNQNLDDDFCFPFTKRDYDKDRSKNHTLLDNSGREGLNNTNLSSLSVTTHEGSLDIDPIDPILNRKIAELESQKIKASIDKNKTMKFRKMLAEARAGIHYCTSFTYSTIEYSFFL